MTKNIIKDQITGESCYIYNHKSGAKIYVIPKPEFSSACAYFGTRYGSVDTCFKTSDMSDFVTVPEGIAHYLEHKLFENEDCDAFERYAKTGAYANAYTSFDRTCYLFRCSQNFDDSFRILLDFVQDPYFTEQTVQKEQGIIGQEINMYKDEPNWSVMFNLLRCLYHNNPVKIDIAGTVESIAKITPELLYQCYNTFYNLKNMFICVAGNVEPDAVFATCDEMLKDKPPVTIERKFFDEPETVVKPFIEQNLPVATPLFNIGYKEKCERADKSLIEVTAAEFTRQILFGNDSPLYKKLFDMELINAEFGAEYYYYTGCAGMIVGGESKEPQKVKQIIDEYINEQKKSGLDKSAFERVKKNCIGGVISAYDSAEGFANVLIDAAISGYMPFDGLNTTAALTYEQTNARFLEMFNTDNSALSVVCAQ